MKKYTTAAMMLVFVAIVSCGGESNSNEVAKVEDTIRALVADTVVLADTISNVDDAHNASNSLDYWGTYKGILPCADCEGIETILTIDSSKKYILKTRYLGKKTAANSPDYKGEWAWVNGSTIKLMGLKNRPNQYFVGENQLFQLDINGNRIAGNLSSKYILVKL